MSTTAASRPEKPSVIGQDVALFRLLASTMSPYRDKLIVAFVLLLATAGLNAVPPEIVRRAIDGPIAQGNVTGLWPLAALYGGLSILMFLLQYVYAYVLQQAAQRALADLRARMFDHVVHQDQSFFGRLPTGDLVTRLTSDVDTINALLSTSAVTIMVESVTLIAIIFVMFAINWRLALLALAVLPLLALVTVYFRSRIRRSSTTERTALAKASAFMNEHINAMTAVQLFGYQPMAAKSLDGFNWAYRRALLLLRKHSALFLAAQEILAAVGMALLLYGGGQGVLAGWATLGTLVAFVQYADRAFQPILRLSEQYNAVQIALGAAERVQRLLLSRPAVQDPSQPHVLERVQGAVELRDVHFAYLEDEPVLRGVSLSIPAGQNVAIVGATGAGKSSLVGLLARFYDPQQGSITLDGTDIRQFRLHDLRRVVAVVPQDPVCLAGTVSHNIRLFRDDISDAQVHHAAEQANAAGFIEQLPGGYDFVVAPGGANLSVGQRQLLALARALALCPEGVLVLDEATSSIDTATEALIQDALERILRTRTSVVIAHRLSTIRNADRIIVMARGQIIEDGGHEQLLAQGGAYARLYRNYLVGQEA